MPTARAVTLYANDPVFLARRDEVIAEINASRPGDFPHPRDIPEWLLKPYFVGATIPISDPQPRAVKAEDIANVLLDNQWYEKIQDAAVQSSNESTRQKCIRFLKLASNGRQFDFQDGSVLADITTCMDSLLASNLLDETTKSEILALGTELVTVMTKWTDGFNEGKPDADKLFSVDPGTGPDPFDNEWPQFKLVWWP